jgi:hypothetical protein
MQFLEGQSRVEEENELIIILRGTDHSFIVCGSALCLQLNSDGIIVPIVNFVISRFVSFKLYLAGESLNNEMGAMASS